MRYVLSDIVIVKEFLISNKIVKMIIINRNKRLLRCLKCCHYKNQTKSSIKNQRRGNPYWREYCSKRKTLKTLLVCLPAFFFREHLFISLAEFSEKLTFITRSIHTGTCAFRGVRNVSVSGNICVLTKCIMPCLYKFKTLLPHFRDRALMHVMRLRSHQEEAFYFYAISPRKFQAPIKLILEYESEPLSSYIYIAAAP